jgi:hypothetical protein
LVWTKNKLKYSGVTGDKTVYELISANMPCRCYVCRGISSTGACIMTEWKNSKTRWVRPKEASDKAPTREPIPEELKRSVSAILGVEVVTVKILTNYLKGNKLKSSGTKLELMNRVLSSSKPGDDTRQDTGVPGESIVLACEAGVHHEDDLEPEEDDSIDTRECSGNY